MRVMLINCVYQSGSTGKIMKDIKNCLDENKVETYVLYGRGQRIEDPNVIKFGYDIESKIHALCSRITGILYDYSYLSTFRLIRYIKKLRPDVVNIHCINGNSVNVYMLISWLKKNNINTLLTNHAEFFFTGNCGYAFECQKYMTGCGKCSVYKTDMHGILFDGTHLSWKKMRNAFSGFSTLKISNVSPWLEERAKNSVILGEFEHYTILNGVDTSVFNYFSPSKEHKENRKKTILHVTANFSNDKGDIKGGYYLIELAKKCLSLDVEFVVAGKYKSGIDVPKNVKLLGQIKNQNKLAELYSNADLVVLTSRRETFSMVVAEALCCGTPVVGFKAGAPERIAISKYCKFVDYPNIDELYSAIEEFLDHDINKNDISNDAIQKYSKERMGKEYLKLYEGFQK